MSMSDPIADMLTGVRSPIMLTAFFGFDAVFKN